VPHRKFSPTDQPGTRLETVASGRCRGCREPHKRRAGDARWNLWELAECGRVRIEWQVASADTITKFWLDNTSGPLAPDAVVNWEFMVPGAKETVTVTGFDAGRRIDFTWSSGLKVEMSFDPQGDGATHVTITVGAFEEKNLLEQVANVVEGFSIVLCDLKTLLEQGRSANLVRDKAELIASAKRAGS
jgi:hypothetical protein